MTAASHRAPLFLSLAILAFSLTGQAGESAAGSWLRKRLSPAPSQERMYYVLAGKESQGGDCFLNIQNDPEYVRLDLEYAREFGHSVTSDDFHLTTITLMAKKDYDWQAAKVKEHDGGFTIENTEKRLEDRTDYSRLEALSEPAPTDVSGIHAVRLTTAMKSTLVPEQSFTETRLCAGMQLLAKLSDTSGQKFAETAAEKWNKSNPTKRQTGEVSFLGCDGYSADTIQCLANGDGEGDGDEPVLWFRYTRDGSFFKLSYVRYDY
jgi:hypothetical protein